MRGVAGPISAGQKSPQLARLEKGDVGTALPSLERISAQPLSKVIVTTDAVQAHCR